MTNKQAHQIMKDTDSKALVMKIVKEFNGESYTYAKKVLDVASFFVLENSYCNSELANSHIENTADDTEGNYIA